MDDLFRRIAILLAATTTSVVMTQPISAQPPSGVAQTAPVQAAPVQAAPVQTAPVESAPVAPEPVPTQIAPDIIRGPAGSQLVGVRQVPSYSSPLSSYLGRSSRASTDAELSRYFQSSTRRRLVKAPEMFGDFRRFSPFATIDEGAGPTTGSLPHGGGVSGLKIAENNQAITADRVWFGFSHMHDAFQSTNGTTGVTTDQSLNRFTLGFEKTFLDGLWSIELRTVLAGNVNEDVFDVGTFGDAQLIFKRLLYADACQARSMGLGLELPTGEQGRLIGDGVIAALNTDSVHLVPFYAATRRFGSRTFAHLFAQLDIPVGTDSTSVSFAGGNTFNRELAAPVTTAIDVGMGYWLIAPNNSNDSGLAAIVEAHYTSRLDSADAVTFAAGPPSTIHQGEVTNDVLNITSGIHAELLGNWAVRLAASAPVTNNKLFDSEIILQLNRTF